MTDTPQDRAQQTIARLTSRLERAEKQLKGLRFLIPGLALIAVVPLLMQLDNPTVISVKSVNAENFAVRSARGDIVAQLGAGKDGSPSIVFLDSNKKIRLMASVGTSGPSVALLDGQEVSRATLSLNDKSDPSLTMSNADKQTRSALRDKISIGRPRSLHARQYAHTLVVNTDHRLAPVCIHSRNLPLRG